MPIGPRPVPSLQASLFGSPRPLDLGVLGSDPDRRAGSPDPEECAPGNAGRSAVAVGAAYGIMGVDAVRSYGIDRSRLLFHAAQNARASSRSQLAILGAGLVGGAGALALGVKSAQRATGDCEGPAGLLSAGGAKAGAQVALGAGLAYGGARFGMKNGGSIVVDLMRGPTIDSVRVAGGRWNIWGKLHGTSNVLAYAGAALALTAGVVNASEAISQDGAAGMVTTRSGRSGLSLLGSAGVAAAFGAFAVRNRGGMGPVRAFFQSEALARPVPRTVRMVAANAVGLPLLPNELGAFDALNRDRSRPPVR